MQCYFFDIQKSRKICTRNLKLHLFNPSVHSFCFWVPSIIINMTHNQWLVLLLQARQLISETSDPLKGQPVWHPVIIHCRCDHHRRVRLSDTQKTELKCKLIMLLQCANPEPLLLSLINKVTLSLQLPFFCPCKTPIAILWVRTPHLD